MDNLVLDPEGDDELVALPPLEESINPIYEPVDIELIQQTRTRRVFYIISIIVLYLFLAAIVYFTDRWWGPAPDFMMTSVGAFRCFTWFLFLFGLGIATLIGLYFAKWVVILPDNIKYYLKSWSGGGREAGPGVIHVKWPFESAYREVITSSLTIYLRLTATVTKDGIPVVVNARMTYKITDIYKAIFNIAPYLETIRRAAESKLNSVISRNTFEFIQDNRDDLEKKLLLSISEESEDKRAEWGTEPTNFEFPDFLPATKKAQNIIYRVQLDRLEAKGIEVKYNTIKEAMPKLSDVEIMHLIAYYALSGSGATPMVNLSTGLNV